MNYEKGAKVVFYLWGIFILIALIENILFSVGIGIPEGMSVIRSNFYSRIFFSIIILALIIFAYRGKEWAYYIFIFFLVYIFITAFFGSVYLLVNAYYDKLPVIWEKYPFWVYIANIISSLLNIFFSGISFYILYRFRYPTTKLFLIRKPRDQ